MNGTSMPRTATEPAPGINHAVACVSFGSPDLLAWLESAPDDALDDLPFGVIALGADGSVKRYNAAEAALSGLTPSRVIGRNFFSSVAPCTNNAMVARRFETEPEIDDVIDYVFTLRVAPRKVRLRLLKRPGARFSYLTVERRD